MSNENFIINKINHFPTPQDKLEKPFNIETEVQPNQKKINENLPQFEIEPPLSHLEKIPTSREFIDLMEKQGLNEYVQAYETVLEISQAIQAAGGQALLVGGSVRDMLLGKIPKDFDLEIYKLEAEQVEEIISKFGKVNDVGKAFGILKISLNSGLDIDISLPRTDSKVAAGHRGFEIKTDPNMTIKEAAQRRDFTFNSMATDPLTSELFDYYGGANDLANGILKITNNERFKDDPLRVMRALQFIGRFELKIHPESVETLKEMIPYLKELPKERIGEEWKKLLLKSPKPSIALEAGMELGVFAYLHPEIANLKNIPQDQEWHPEGDVWQHSLLVVDQAAKTAEQQKLPPNEALVLLLSSLSHDFGKVTTTELADGHIRSHGHEAAGEEPTRAFLNSLAIDTISKEKIIKLVVAHLAPTMLYIAETNTTNGISDGAIRRLAQKLYPATIQELVMVSEADHLGRGPFADEGNETGNTIPRCNYLPKEWLLNRAQELNVKNKQPESLTLGRDWIQFGFKPGKHLGALIKLANDLRDEKGLSKLDIFTSIQGISEPGIAIQKLESMNT